VRRSVYSIERTRSRRDTELADAGTSGGADLTIGRRRDFHKLGMRVLLIVAIGMLVFVTGCTGEATMGDATIQVESGATTQQGGPGDTTAAPAASSGLELFFLLTFLSLLPTILMTVTSFTRVIIVLSFARNAIGVPQLPPNQVLIGLALFLSVFIMAPIGSEINKEALQPYMGGEIAQAEAFHRAEEPLREFMFKQTRERDIALFMQLGDQPRPKNEADVPTWVLVPSFIISELKTAFQMGFIIFIPFLIIDLIVSSALMALGMMMLPPVIVSLPFKILLFVMVDGWDLIIKSLVMSFN
jgi:flagellar biosynthesis protein FliP